MKLGDIYKHKTNNSVIRIDSFATRMNRSDSEMIIIFHNIEKNNDMYGYSPSFNGYGSQTEIENEYELLVPQEKTSDYDDWDEIFRLIEQKY